MDQLVAIALFHLLMLVGLGVFLWAWRLGFAGVEQSTEYDAVEKAAVRSQMKALLLFPLFVIVLVDYPLVLGQDAQIGQLVLSLIIASVMLGYLAISSIRNRVSIFRGRGRLPIKGQQAVWNGVVNLAVLIIGDAVLIYYTLLK